MHQSAEAFGKGVMDGTKLGTRLTVPLTVLLLSSACSNAADPRQDESASLTTAPTTSCVEPRTLDVEPTMVGGAEQIRLGDGAYSVVLGFGAAWIQLLSTAQMVRSTGPPVRSPLL